MQNLAINLKKQKEERGAEVAIVHEGCRATYSELWNKAQAIMHHMEIQGFNPGDRVSFLLPNSIEYVAAYYAVLGMAGVVVPLNTAAKERDLTNWIKHSGSSWLFADASHPELAGVIEAFNGKVLLCNSKKEQNCDEAVYLESVLSSYDGRVVEINNDMAECHPASIIYTSGTTGEPKGVTLSHQNLITNTRSIIEYLGLEETDSIVNVLPFYYSYGNSVLHTHIAVGGKIVLANNMIYPKLVLELIEKESVTGFSGVPSTFALLLNRSRITDYNLSSLRYITQAGGNMPPVNIIKMITSVEGIKFFVMYGQTEASARLSYLPPEKLEQKMGSIGIAIPGVELEIRNKKGQKVQVDEIGEIYARGGNIMLGYWSDLKRTKEVLIDGWLKTGDLAHYDKDYYLYIDGRSSEMIKTGANRVSPKDIEEVIFSIDGVEDAAVIGVPDDMLGQVIKAFVVRRKSSDLDKKDILVFCKKNLAIYKIPKIIEFVNEIPKTASGKVRRFLLK
jgi:long-chain acyl-CoA synthetase